MTSSLLWILVLLGADARFTGSVVPALAEFRMPIESPAGGAWVWNRSDTADNAGEYAFSVTVNNGTAESYSFGFYLYKFPGSPEKRGPIQELLKAGQMSVFRQDATGRGDLMSGARVEISAEAGELVLRLRDPQLIRQIFGAHPQTAAVHTRTPSSSGYETLTIHYDKR